MKTPLIIATRKSALALKQANYVKEKLTEQYSTLNVDLLALSTAGDDNTTTSLTEIGGKNLFVKTLQQAILNNRADIAVHSIKDLSVNTHPDLQLTAICQREDPRDAFIAKEYQSLTDLPEGAVVGTASPRRTCQIKACRPDLHIKLLRGNVETRLKKLDRKEYDAIILAAAGLNRLNLSHHITAYLDPTIFIPAIGQGAIGIECRANNTALIKTLACLNDHNSHTCVIAERVVNQHLKGDCHTPIGAHATLNKQGELHLIAMVGSLDGKLILRAERTGRAEEARKIGEQVAHDLLAQGAEKLL